MTLTYSHVVGIFSSRGIFPGRSQKLLDHSKVEQTYYHKTRFTLFTKLNPINYLVGERPVSTPHVCNNWPILYRRNEFFLNGKCELKLA